MFPNHKPKDAFAYLLQQFRIFVYDGLIQSYRDDVEKYARNRTQLEVIRYILQAGWAEAGEAFRALEKALLLELAYPTTNNGKGFRLINVPFYLVGYLPLIVARLLR